MDFGNIELRIRRLNAALGEYRKEATDSSIHTSRTALGNGRFQTTITFGFDSEEQNQNKLLGIIHQVASFKDPIKAKLNSIEKSPQTYEKTINGSLALSLVTDLDNKNKHVNNTRHPRTVLNPNLKNIQQVLHGRGKTRGSLSGNLITGETKIDYLEGDIKIEIYGEVVDGDGNFIMTVYKMINDAIQEVEGFLRDNGL